MNCTTVLSIQVFPRSGAFVWTSSRPIHARPPAQGRVGCQLSVNRNCLSGPGLQGQVRSGPDRNRTVTVTVTYDRDRTVLYRTVTLSVPCRGPGPGSSGRQTVLDGARPPGAYRTVPYRPYRTVQPSVTHTGPYTVNCNYPPSTESGSGSWTPPPGRV